MNGNQALQGMFYDTIPANFFAVRFFILAFKTSIIHRQLVAKLLGYLRFICTAKGLLLCCDNMEDSPIKPGFHLQQTLRYKNKAIKWSSSHPSH